ncbi:hypothetical protein AB7310_01985 [Cylindrospermopsis raciborskii UAM/DH-BiRr]
MTEFALISMFLTLVTRNYRIMDGMNRVKGKIKLEWEFPNFIGQAYHL